MKFVISAHKNKLTNFFDSILPHERIRAAAVGIRAVAVPHERIRAAAGTLNKHNKI